MNTIAWNEWNPGLDNDQMMLGEVQRTLPGVAPEEVNKLVRLLENPESPLALTGAVSLERHDCIHIMLGRGLLSQDEAFVIGYTMGTAGSELKPLETFLFKKVARYLYPTPYRMTKKNLKVYDLGVRKGRKSGVDKIYDFPFEEYHDWRLGELRDKLGINTLKLREAYREEQILMPNTKASTRLPV